MLTEENRKNILHNLIEVISDISDKDYQRRVWIRREGLEIDSFVETVCYFFGVCDPVLDEYRKFKITESQFYLLKKFRNRFKAFSNENDFPEEFIDHIEWDEIREMAKEVLMAFNYNKEIK